MVTDADLVRAAREGRTEAFGELVRRHQRGAVALAYSLLGDAAEAEDMAQEAFLRAMRNLDMLADPERFAAWFRRVVFGTCVDWLRAFRPELYRASTQTGHEEHASCSNDRMFRAHSLYGPTRCTKVPSRTRIRHSRGGVR